MEGEHSKNTNTLTNGDFCIVIGGKYKGEEGAISDLNISKTGHLTVTVTKENGVRFKTLGKNVQKKIIAKL